MAKKTNLKEQNPAQLTDLLREKREELRTIRFGAVGARSKDSSAAKKGRADVARILTELHTRSKEAPAA